jgi:hypothetical protein
LFDPFEALLDPFDELFETFLGKLVALFEIFYFLRFYKTFAI